MTEATWLKESLGLVESTYTCGGFKLVVMRGGYSHILTVPAVASNIPNTVQFEARHLGDLVTLARLLSQERTAPVPTATEKDPTERKTLLRIAEDARQLIESLSHLCLESGVFAVYGTGPSSVPILREIRDSQEAVISGLAVLDTQRAAKAPRKAAAKETSAPLEDPVASPSYPQGLSKPCNILPHEIKMPNPPVDFRTRDGVQRIADERAEQVKKWAGEHDDTHSDGTLAVVAAILATAHTDAVVSGAHDAIDGNSRDAWGLHQKHLDTVRRLEIAGALIAAEIDRVNRREERKRWR